jgi:SpoIID/LytB domain protein
MVRKHLHKIIFSVAFILLLFLPSMALAQQTVRIGLYYDINLRTNNTITASTLVNEGGLSVSLQLEEILPLPLSYRQVNLTASKSQYVQIGAGQSFEGAYQLASEAKDKWAYKTYIAYRRDNTQYPFKVWVEGLEAAVRINYPGGFAVNMQGDFIFLSDGQSGQTGVIADDRVPLILSPQGTAPTRVAAGGQFTRNYQGAFEIRVSAGRLAMINVLDMEQYVFGVVPYEMFEFWPIEALKAQAVAARSYAVVNQAKHRALGFGLCDASFCCQRYAGYDSTNVNSLRAVQETAGMVARHNGSVAQLFYHSNSGGHTENSEDVWSGSLPYIAAVPDPYSVSSTLLQHLVSRANNSTEFPATWLRSYTRAEVEEMLSQNQMNVGSVLEILPVQKSAGGRHLELLVRGTAGEARILRGATRTVFNLSSSLYEIIPAYRRVHVISAGEQVKEIAISQSVYAAAGRGAVPVAGNSLEVAMTSGSRNRTVSKLPAGFSFDGKGSGHGVGMSQWGAFEMAKQGYSYDEILKYYFLGINVGPL